MVVGALHQNYVLIPRPVFEQAAARHQFDDTLDELYRGDSRHCCALASEIYRKVSDSLQI